MELSYNIVKLRGTLVSVKRVWSSSEHTVFEGYIEILRSSGVTDVIPVLYNDVELDVNSTVFVQGQFRSRDININGKMKVELYVFAQSIVKDNGLVTTDLNEVKLSGFVCKKPVLRNTPSGKQICDLTVACNYNKDKSAYIPVVTWGKYARRSGKYFVGTPVEIIGRIQSRGYTKEVDGQIQQFIAYELSVTSIDSCMSFNVD